MKKRKELSVEIDSVMTSYSYYAFPQCILKAPDKIGSKIAEFSILDTVKEGWNSQGNIKNMDFTSNWEVKSEDRYRRGCNGCIYREMEYTDYISINVNYQQYTESWGAVNLFITDNEKDILLGDRDYLCRFGNFIYNGVNLYLSGEWQRIPKVQFEPHYQLVLSRWGNRVEVYAGKEKAKMLAVNELDLPTNKRLFIGVQVKHGDNSFYPWYFSNFIQLSCDITNLDRRLEFHYGLLKHWDCNLFHYFLDVNTCEGANIIELGAVKFIKKCIEQGKYLEAKLEQYFIQGWEEYKLFHHMHQNLIYGYDDTIKSFLLIGYDNMGKLTKAQITYEDIKKSIKDNAGEIIKIITYSQDSYLYEFDENYVWEMICQYLQGTNSSQMMQNIVPRTEREYGIKVYEQLMSDAGIEVLISDRRVAHLLWEHKKCMVERIAYLMELGVLSQQDGAWAKKEMDEVLAQVYDLKNIILKYQKCPKKINKPLIIDYLSRISKCEKNCLENMLMNWKHEKGGGFV